jgi:UDP-glucuronate 4-epimerase
VKILVTGAAGFIGFHISLRLIQLKFDVVGLDNLNDYYDISLKQDRLEQLKMFSNFTFYTADITDSIVLDSIFSQNDFDYVIHLAA